MSPSGISRSHVEIQVEQGSRERETLNTGIRTLQVERDALSAHLAERAREVEQARQQIHNVESEIVLTHDAYRKAQSPERSSTQHGNLT